MLVALAILFSPILAPIFIVAAPVLFFKGIAGGYTGCETLNKIGRLCGTFVDFLAPAKHDMKSHVFKEGKQGNAELNYEGDVPVLTLNPSPDHKSLGFDQGYLLAEPLQMMLQKWDALLWLIIPSPEKVPELCSDLKKRIPADYLDELDGMAEGFNQRMKETGVKERLTADKLLLYQLVPDMLHSRADALEKALQHPIPQTSSNVLPALGCTAILDYDENGEVVFARNMDWPSLSVAGKFSFIVRRECGEKQIVEIGTPGMIGTITAMSSSGLALCMNVCEGETQDAACGLPASILNRLCIEKCDTISEVDGLVEKHPPLGPYHLSASEKYKAKAFHFYQGEGNQHFTRILTDAGPLVTTNCRYNGSGPYRHYAKSREREQNIQLFLQHAKGVGKKERASQALRLPVVNNVETVHHVSMSPGKGEMHLAFNNAFAADDQKSQITF